jgi:general secretion pathway protein D
VPGLNRLPIVGRLFSNNSDTVNKTEVVLLITPRVIRNIERPGVRLEEFNSGTELDIGRGGGGGALPPVSIQESPRQPAAPQAPRPPAAGPAPKPDVREAQPQ